MNALHPVAALFFLYALEPRLWPGAFAYLLAWALLPRWRGELAWGAPLFTLYLFWGLELSPEGFGDLTERLAAAGRLTAGLLVWAYAASLAVRGSRWAVAPLFVWAFLLRPGATAAALGLVAWIYWTFWLRRARQRERGAPFEVAPRALAAAALGALALAAFLAFSGWSPGSPAPSGPGGGPPPAGLEAPVREAPPEVGSGSGAPAAAGPRGRLVFPAWVDALSRYAAVLVGVATFLLLIVLGRIVWILLREPGRRIAVNRRAVLLGVLVLLTLLFWAVWYGLLYGGEGVGAGAFAPEPPPARVPGAGLGEPPAEVPAPAPAWPGWALGGALGLGLLALVVLIAALVALLPRLFRSEEGALENAVESAVARGRTARQAGRVRAAYRGFLLAMRPQLPKRASETPQEYARRVAARRPPLAEAVRELTRLYEPVRYGGLADEAEAAAAEAWLRRIENELAKEEET